MAFIGYPPIEFALVASKWLKAKCIPSVIDVKDLWPQIFVEVLPLVIQPIGKILFYPYFYYAKKTIKNVDAISSMSNSFLKSFLKFSNKKPTKLDKVFRLTSPIKNNSSSELITAKNWWKELNINKTEFNLFFVGTFCRNFDCEPIRDAAFKAQINGKKWRFILCGDGPRFNELNETMRGLDNVFFPGWIDINKINALSRMSVATIAPYINIENFLNNIPNKIVDSLALGLPILSPLEGEVGELIKKHKVGLSYDKETSLFQCIDEITKNKALQQDLSKNASKIYNKSFEYNKVYDDFILYLEELSVKTF